MDNKVERIRLRIDLPIDEKYECKKGREFNAIRTGSTGGRLPYWEVTIGKETVLIYRREAEVISSLR